MNPIFSTLTARIFAMVAVVAAQMAVTARCEQPQIRKLGTLDLDMVESTPIVFRDQLYRFEYVRPNYSRNKTGESYFRFIDVENGKATPPFAHTYDLGCAFVDGDTMWVFGVDNWDGERIASFHSRDLEHWERQEVLHLSGWGLFNSSVCKAVDRYILAFEVGRPPEVVGVPFTTRFAESSDLKSWKLLNDQHVFTKDRYSACPSIRYLDGQFYMTYLEAMPGPAYETYIVRSPDLIHWEPSPLNPMLRASPDDKHIASAKLIANERAKITAATDINNSDVDFCEFRGKTVINYSWGNQQGTEFLAAAEYDGPVAKFLKSYFPAK